MSFMMEKLFRVHDVIRNIWQPFHIPGEAPSQGFAINLNLAFIKSWTQQSFIPHLGAVDLTMKITWDGIIM